MKAQVIAQFGDPDVFQTVEFDKPNLIPGHVLVRVQSTSVNQIDCKIRRGLVPAIAPEFPAVLHGDVAGIIDAVASDVEDFKIGDEVYACAGGLRGTGGALAEFMLVDVRSLAAKPKTLSMQETVALPLVSITAWEALFTKAKLQAKQNILIHGGLGGVGHIAVQLAKWANAHVCTTVLSNDDFALVKSLGADEVINAKEESVEQYVQRLTNGQGFDVVFDTVGGPNLDRSLAAAKIDGVVVTTAARSTHDLTPMHNKGLSLHVVFMLNPLLTGNGRDAHGKILQALAKIIDEGKLKPLIDKHQFSFDQVGEAHALLESGKARGKVVLVQN
jgi:NADPH2:quinone reductase